MPRAHVSVPFRRCGGGVGIGPYRQCEWTGGVVSFEAVIGRSDNAAIAVRRIVAFQDGFELELVAWVRRPSPQRRPGRFPNEILLAVHGPFGLHDNDGNLIDALVRFGVQFPDGAKVTNLVDNWAPSPDATEPMHGLESQSGSGSDGQATQEFWVWPLPDDGDIALVCEWPAHGIPESSVMLDGDVLRDAAARSRPVWTDEPTASHFSRHRMMNASGWSSSGIGHTVRAARTDNDTEGRPDSS
jgi:hypothetical protein